MILCELNVRAALLKTRLKAVLPTQGDNLVPGKLEPAVENRLLTVVTLLCEINYFSQPFAQASYVVYDGQFMDEKTARREIVAVGKLLYDRSYVVSSDGNVSVRLDDDRIVATPTMTCKGRMTEDSLAITDLDGKPLSKQRPSSELAMHLLIYQERPEIRAVCHAHPPHGSAFAVAGLAIDQPILSEVILTLGCVPLAEYGTPSTSELTENMRPLVKHHNALLMANHGAVAYGDDVWQAFDRLETLEHTAKIAILSRALGGANNLPADAIEKLINVREAAGYLDERARCQACGYLHETTITCPLDESAPAVSKPKSASNGAKISLTRDELVDLLSQAVRSNLS